MSTAPDGRPRSISSQFRQALRMRSETLRRTHNFVHHVKYLIEIPETCQVEILRTANLSKADFLFQRPIYIARLFLSRPRRLSPTRASAIRARPSSLRRRLFPPAPPTAWTRLSPRVERRRKRGACAAVDQAKLKKRRRTVDESRSGVLLAAHSASARRLPRSSKRRLP